MKTILITYAVKEEFINVKPEGRNIRTVFTGIGKTRSAMMLTKSIMELNPSLVINIGTAGTLIHNIGDIFICRRFVDRDYKITKLPGISYEIDSSVLPLNDERLEKQIAFEKYGICSTGDTFVTEISSLEEDVVDMEAYAQAFVCKEFNIPFIAIKYITDIIGQNSVKHWENKLADARSSLERWFNGQ